MSTDADQSSSAVMSVTSDNADDAGKDARLAVSCSVDSVAVAASHRWSTAAEAAAAAAAAAAATSHDNDTADHHEFVDKTSVDTWHASSHLRSLCPTAPPTALYGRLAGAGSEFDAGCYDYSYSPQYSGRYTTTFQAGASSSSYVGAVTPYAAPYSPAGLGAYTFNLAAGPCAAAAAAAGAAVYNSSYMPHHLSAPSAALLSTERSAPNYHFTAASASLLQSRTSLPFL